MYKDTIIIIDYPETMFYTKERKYLSKKKYVFIIFLIIFMSCLVTTQGGLIPKKNLETKKIQDTKNGTNFTLQELVEELKKINMTIDHTNVVTRDISKIDLAVDAASFLVGLVQTYLGSNKAKKKESPVVIQYNFTNYYNYYNTSGDITDSHNIESIIPP